MFGMYSIGSLTSITPYNVHERALRNVVALVKNGKEFVDRSLITVWRVASGDPIRITERQTPTRPRKYIFPKKAR